MKKRKWINQTADDVVTISGSIWNNDTRTVANAVNYNAQILKDALNRISELEKHFEPQTPTIENGFVKCPKCKKYIRFPIADKYNNCPECGQAIKWAESEG